jgi:hypothetical protein
MLLLLVDSAEASHLEKMDVCVASRVMRDTV